MSKITKTLLIKVLYAAQYCIWRSVWKDCCLCKTFDIIRIYKNTFNFKNYAGVCKKGLTCNEKNICETTPVQCSGAGIKCWDGASVSPVEGVRCCDRCEITAFNVDANCNDASTGSCGVGESDSGTPCFPPDPANPITCCNNRACDIKPDSNGNLIGKCP